MYINTNVVTALLALKGASVSDLARISGIHTAILDAWLYPASSSDAEREVLPIDLQLAVLAALGVRGETLRSDLVHSWHIQEPVFGSARAAWEPLETVVAAFGGRAEVSYVAGEADPFISLTPSVLYTLRFRDFVATLKVTSSIFRVARFEPERVKGLSWMANGFGILLSEEDYAKADDGALMPTDANEMLALADESVQWAALRESMAGLKLPPDALAKLLLMAQEQSANRLSAPAAPATAHGAPATAPAAPAMAPAPDIGPAATPPAFGQASPAQPAPASLFIHS